MSSHMKAVNYVGPFKVRVEDVEKPKLEHPEDVIVKVTTVSDHALHESRILTRPLRLQSVARTYSKCCGTTWRLRKIQLTTRRQHVRGPDSGRAWNYLW